MFRPLKLQTAIEYLTTYGWAIMIIAVVIAGLFSLGANTGITGTEIVASAGPSFLVSGAALVGSNLSFTLGQSTGGTIYNIAMACAATATAQGLPNGGSIVYISTNGSATQNMAKVATAGDASLENGATMKVDGLVCFGPNGAPVSKVIGTDFTGQIWLNYTKTPGPATVFGSPNAFSTVVIARVSTRVE